MQNSVTFKSGRCATLATPKDVHPHATLRHAQPISMGGICRRSPASTLPGPKSILTSPARPYITYPIPAPGTPPLVVMANPSTQSSEQRFLQEP